MKRQVGQILYVAARKQMVVYPIQVIEEITKKTLAGSETTYMVRITTRESGHKDILISEIQDEVFDSAAMARETLTQRATASIAKIVENACSVAQSLYPGGFEASSVDVVHDPAELAKLQQQRKKRVSANDIPHDGELVELPDGKMGRIGKVVGLGE